MIFLKMRSSAFSGAANIAPQPGGTREPCALKSQRAKQVFACKTPASFDHFATDLKLGVDFSNFASISHYQAQVILLGTLLGQWSELASLDIPELPTSMLLPYSC